MNRYFTDVELENYAWKIGYKDKILFMGSCFTENIGEIMAGLKFQTLINPFGILYNPLSIAASLRRLMDPKPYCKADLFEHNGVWGSFDFHSRYSASSADEALAAMNEQLQLGHDFLKEADYLILTWGTSWVYERKEAAGPVANCHKFPASDFHRYRLSQEQIVGEFTELLTCLQKFNPKLKFLSTVSPIRHLKDTAHGNQLSKSTLLLALDQLAAAFGKQHFNYFPSYEIVMDELRDYRFYAPDLVHLSPVAVEHIWGKFSDVLLSQEAHRLMVQIGKLRKAVAHRPFRKDIPGYVKFLTQHIDKINQLIINFPSLNLDREKEYFQQELNGCEQQ
ncbi:GSCFA domain-containing protein [Mangrovibacterium marinum]|nr:GSCFA domain-containing protein [Mangrovibacterium marinum]